MFRFIKLIFHFFGVKIYDLILYLRYKQWNDFNKYGLNIFVGMFGSGKTSSMVRRVYNIASKYKHVQILTNMSLYNFPKHTKIIPLIDVKQIKNCQGDTVILIDEISALFNSRQWNKGGIHPSLLTLLLQVRKEKKVIYATAQRFEHVDALMRQITFRIIKCDLYFNRWCVNKIFDAWKYEKMDGDIFENLEHQDREVFIQTGKIRKMYNTDEIMEKMRDEEFIPEMEILEKQGNNAIGIINTKPEKTTKKIGMRLRERIKGGKYK